MAGNENSGGYRQPNNPAPVSPPGALSQRTDGGAIDGMTQPQGQQAVPTYKSRDEAIQGGAKPGDVVYIPGVGKVRMR